MDIHTTCDDEMKVYYDGELKPKIQAGCFLDWKITCHGFIPGTVKVLAIECKNTKAGPLGILASSRSTGLTTNAKWLCYKVLQCVTMCYNVLQCVTMCYKEPLPNWTRPDFVIPPNTFSPAKTFGNNTPGGNTHPPWGVRLIFLNSHVLLAPKVLIESVRYPSKLG